eukprot:IDg10024t1
MHPSAIRPGTALSQEKKTTLHKPKGERGTKPYAFSISCTRPSMCIACASFSGAAFPGSIFYSSCGHIVCALQGDRSIATNAIVAKKQDHAQGKSAAAPGGTAAKHNDIARRSARAAQAGKFTAALRYRALGARRTSGQIQGSTQESNGRAQRGRHAVRRKIGRGG